MKFKTQKIHYIFLFLFVTLLSKAQNETIKGKIFNAVNGEAMPFTTVNLLFSQEKKAVDTDFDGFFQFPTAILPDSIIIEKDGFLRKSLAVKDFSSLELF
jgi:hypothetical protein